MSSANSDLMATIARWFAKRTGGHLDHDLWHRALMGPASEFLHRPGNGWRSALVAAGWQLGGNTSKEVAIELECAIELIHAGSLILDDIEDDADCRRGKPALHRHVGLPVALNTGSWMVFAALDLLRDAPVEPSAQIAMVERARQVVLDCHHGQALDLGLPVSSLTAEQIPGVVASSTALRTASLTALAAELGALASDASGPRRSALSEVGRQLGTALQMLDDLGGLVTDERINKGCEDLHNMRPTWPWAWLIRGHRDRLAELVERAASIANDDDACAVARELGTLVEPIGREQAEQCLARATSILLETFPASPARHATIGFIETLKTRYG